MQFEDACRAAADELTQPRPEGEEQVEDIQVMLKSDANPIQIRQLRVGALLLIVIWLPVFMMTL